MDTQKLKANHGTIRFDGDRIMGIAPNFAPQPIKDAICATNATPHNAAELVKRWNQFPILLAALKHTLQENAVNIDWQMVADTIKAAESE